MTPMHPGGLLFSFSFFSRLQAFFEVRSLTATPMSSLGFSGDSFSGFPIDFRMSVGERESVLGERV